MAGRYSFVSATALALTGLAAIASSVAPARDGVATVAPFDGIPNVTMLYYDVAGHDAKTVRKSIDAARPTDPNDGKRVDGLSGWHFTWRWRRNDVGTCSATPDDIRFTATVRVPRLADATAPRAVRDRFDRYLASLLAHEDGHVRHAWDRRAEIARAMAAADCETINAAALAAVKAIGAHDLEYDRATRHGTTTILPFG